MVALMPSIRTPSIRRWDTWRGVGTACCAGACCSTSRRVRGARGALGGLTDERVGAVVGTAGEPGHSPRQLPHVRGSGVQRVLERDPASVAIFAGHGTYRPEL
jgi:hypothetical protein